MANMTIDREMLNKPKEKYWLTYIKSRIRKNKNFLGFISGQTGSGKSWSSLSICEDLDKDFGVDRVVFSGLELMTLINEGKLKRGSAICFEEVGIEMSNKNWQSVTNKMLNYLIQTFRHRGFILLMNSPYMDFVDSSTRKLFHAEMSTMGIDFNAGECKLKPQLIQYNSRIQKFYFKRLKVIKAEGVIPVDVWKVKKPSKVLIDSYEAKKREFTDNLNRRIMFELEEVQNKQKKGRSSELTDIQRDTVEMLKQGLNVGQIALARGREKSVVRASIDLIKKKGYQVKAVFDGNKLLHYEVLEPEGK